jgi:hypothetical protein
MFQKVTTPMYGPQSVPRTVRFEWSSERVAQAVEVLADCGFLGRFGLIPNCFEPHSQRLSSIGIKFWRALLSE